MLIPSIDLMDGRAVQLVGGRAKAIDAGDPRPIAERFALAGEIAVVDLDAALGRGSNAATIEALLRIAPCRVGGGIRDVETARRWLDAGATRVVLGTAAVPEVLSKLPRERVVAALDAVDGEVVVEGWRTRTGATIEARLRALAPFVGGFLVTIVEREGRMGGIDAACAERLAALRPAECDLVFAGGVTDAAEIARLDALGLDAQVGMALYAGRLDLADAIAAPLAVPGAARGEALWPTLVCDERGTALGLAWSDAASLREAVRRRAGIYRSRRRGLWVKGETSGDRQELLRVDLDCDRDCLRFTVRQAGRGFCHRGTRTCFGGERGLSRLARTLGARRDAAPDGSYVRRLMDDPELLAAKLREEAEELVAASSPAEVIHEAADVLFFALARAAAAGVDLADIEAELDRRALRTTRRAGDAKTTATNGGGR